MPHIPAVLLESQGRMSGALGGRAGEGSLVRHLSVSGVSLQHRNRDAPDMSCTKGVDYVETALKVFKMKPVPFCRFFFLQH